MNQSHLHRAPTGSPPHMCYASRPASGLAHGEGFLRDTAVVQVIGLSSILCAEWSPSWLFRLSSLGRFVSNRGPLAAHV